MMPLLLGMAQACSGPQTFSGSFGVVIDILVFTWLACLQPALWDHTLQVLCQVPKAKCAKRAESCLAHDFDFAPFSFSLLWPFGPAAQEILTRVCEHYVSHSCIRPWEAHLWVYH